MILIPIKEEFDQMLFSVSSLVTQLEEHRYTFIDEVRAFIGLVEKQAEKYRIPIASEIGILRGRLCVIDEVLGSSRSNGGGYNPDTRRAYRRNRDAFTLKQLDETCQLIRNYFSAAETIFQETLGLCRQAASIAQIKAILPVFVQETKTDQRDRETQLRSLWEKMKQDPDLCSLCTHIIGLAGIHNTIILFDRALGEIGV